MESRDCFFHDMHRKVCPNSHSNSHSFSLLERMYERRNYENQGKKSAVLESERIRSGNLHFLEKKVSTSQF